MADREKIKNKKWIVIIDDDESSLHLLVWMLYEKGESVAGFTNELAALEFLSLRAGRIKAVITDLSMPVMDGLTLAEQIRENEKVRDLDPVPMAFLTAHRQSAGGATERVADKCGVSKIWHKPEDTPELPEKIESWLAEVAPKIETKEIEQNAL